MGARLLGMRVRTMWLAGAAAMLWPLAAAASGEQTGFVELQVEPAAPVVIAAPEPESATTERRIAGPATEERVEAPAAEQRSAAIEVEPERLDLGLPDVPQVAVTMPAAEESRTGSVLPAASAQAAPVDGLPQAPVPADGLPQAIERRLADAALPLPPKFAARDRDGLASAYAAAGNRPFWIRNGAFTPAAETLIDRLARADEDGLDPGDYPVPTLAGGTAGPGDLAEADLKLSAAAYLYARDARGGRLEPNRLGGLITPKLDLPGVERVLATLSANDDAGAALQGFNPRYPGYAALREKLAEIRANRPAASAGHRRGTVVASTAAIGGMQSRWSPRLESDLVANMERWRWLPAKVGERYILVNIPEYRLRLVEAGEVIHETRVITGTPQTPTPIFSDLMDHAIVNPSWFVPPSILKKMNVESAARQGYHVTQRRGVTSVRMPPGPRNALGYIKFMFPNDHAVYLHDTPNRGLFGGASRALSHGCVRVQNPFELGGKILGAQWTESRLKGMIGYGERMIKLDERLPIHLAYFTLYVDEAGDLKSFGDVYGHNSRVRRALGLGA